MIESATAFPRTLLLTRWCPSARYSGAELLRKTVAVLPRDRIRWAYVAEAETSDRGPFPEHRRFPPRILHWRLRQTFLQYFHLHCVQSQHLAREIAEWIRPFNPEVLWVASDLEALSVGYHLAECLGVRLHATVYDGYECARFFWMPTLFFPLYRREIRRFMGKVSTLDAVSSELLEHVHRRYPRSAPQGSVVFHPSISADFVRSLPKRKEAVSGDSLRKIGFCGASRASDGQWARFMGLLARLPFRFEITAYAAQGYFHRSPCPRNVRILFQPYAPERDIVRHFREEGVDACYLGLWKDARRTLFSKASLSSKLVTYAAAGSPVIVDAPVDSAAWRLVDAHGAGVSLCGEDEDTLGRLRRIFDDSKVRNRMSEGAESLCLAEFGLEKNVTALVALLREAGGRRC